MINLQTLFASLNTLAPEITPSLLVQKISTAPRKLLGLAEIEIKEGAMANLTLFSPSHSWKFEEHHNLSKGINSPFLNQELKGKVLGVVANGLYQFDESLAVRKANG